MWCYARLIAKEEGEINLPIKVLSNRQSLLDLELHTTTYRLQRTANTRASLRT